MNRTTTTFGRLLAVVAALAVAAIAATAVSAATGKGVGTGTWVGTLSQDLSALDEPYTTKLVVSVLKGRLVGIVASVRMECPGSMIRDARVSKGWLPGQGPKLTAANGFSVKVGDAVISGHLGQGLANGHASAVGHGCHGNGSWIGKRRY